MDKEPITTQGLEKLKIELDEFKNNKRPKIIEAIAEARAHGDLKENAEYHAAKEEQSKIEGRIIEINDLLARANVIDITKLEKKETVVFGSTIYLTDLDNNGKKIYKIVGKDEADIKKNYIYFRSPVGKALIGKNKKELVTVITPSGEKNFEINEVKYIWFLINLHKILFYTYFSTVKSFSIHFSSNDWSFLPNSFPSTYPCFFKSSPVNGSLGILYFST